ncbi:MAG TPA: PaaI family thioesterase [Chitinophagales bacterium]
MSATNRTRTYSWEDPMIGAKQAMTMNGLDYLQAISAKQLPPPPLTHTLDIGVGEVEKGKVVFTFVPQEFHYNPIGTVHGGVISTIIDSAMGCTLHSLLEAGTGYTTLELKVNFLKAITVKTGELRAIGKVINLGSRTALVEAELVDEKGTLYAYGVSTCLILKP